MPPARKPAVPRYRSVADVLMGGILSGKFPVGTILPGETEVATQFAISRHTARDAMRILEQAGMITRRRRVGSMVVKNELPMRYNQRIESLNDLLQYSNASRLKVLESTEVTLSPAQAQVLRVKPGTPCMFLIGIRYQRHDNRPFAYSKIFLPVTSAATRAQMRDPLAAARELTRKVNTPHLQCIEQTLVAELATRKLAGILKIRAGAALLKSMRVYFGSSGKIAATSTTWHAGDLFSYSTTLTKSD